jgi:tetratricopeptide (TPR) repeat protein
MSEQLADLIAGCDKTEKRTISALINRYESDVDSNLTRLFDLLVKYPDLDNKRISDSLQISASSLANLRKLLLARILEALKGNDTYLDVQIKEKQQNAIVLFRRRSYSLALEELEYALFIARKYDRYYAHLEILLFKCDIVIERNVRNQEEELLNLHTEINRLMDLISIEKEYRQIRQKSFLLLRSRYSLRTDELSQRVELIFNDNRLKSLPDESNLLISHHFYLTQSNRFLIQGKYNEAVRSYGELISLWERNSDYIDQESMTYLKLLSNHANAIFSAGDMDGLMVSIEKIKNHKINSSEEAAEKFQNYYYLLLLLALNGTGLDQINDLATEIESGLKKHRTKINKARELAFYHNIGMAYFLLLDWKESLRWIEKIVSQDKTEHRQDLQHTARMLRIVLWYELGKHDLLEYEIVNVERFLRKRKAWFAYESSVTKFFGKLIVTEDSDRKKAIQNFIAKFDAATEGKNSASLPGASEIRYWLKSKVTGTTMRELLREDQGN